MSAAVPGLAGHGKREPLLRRRAARRRAPASTVGLQTQVREDPLDDRPLEDRHNDLELTAAVRAVLDVDLESETSAKTNLYSSYVAAKTRLSKRANITN